MVDAFTDYQLLDSGDGARLERFGAYTLQRPAQQAIWRRSTAWRPDAVFTRDASGYGGWNGQNVPRSTWEIGYDGLKLELKATNFGHLGVFPEGQLIWRRVARGLDASCRFLNLFAYTGVMSLVASRSGAEVTHVDAVKNTVEWARQNSQNNGLDQQSRIRWITEDARKYVQRELRRGSRYQGLALDPPTFGRGSRKEVWQIERDLADHLSDCVELLAEDARFLVLTSHTPGLVGPVLANMLRPLLGSRGGRIDEGNLLLEVGSDGPSLPSGSFAWWSRE